MSRFFIEDTVAFKNDPLILGTIDYTWSSIDAEPSLEPGDCYFHKNLPVSVKKAWLRESRLVQGYVIIEFMNCRDGFCLVKEKSLRLVDRSFTVGDIVKRKASDTESGTVISTSMHCTLQSCRNLQAFQEVSPAFVQTRPNSSTPLNKAHQPNDPAADLPSLEVPASELTYWNDYREEDFIIYKDWVGQIRYILDAVSICLSNGSIVTVYDSQDLERPIFQDQSSAVALTEHLRALGYGRRKTRNAPLAGRCYPGQVVGTQKPNLRLGNWKYGSYDPKVKPLGMVVEVRCVQLEVEWLFPNVFRERESPAAPTTLLSTDELNSGDILIYDRSAKSSNGLSSQLPNACYSPDFGFGNLVRLRDSASAALNYHSLTQGLPSNAMCDGVPRIEPQGFGMNVFQIVRTQTRVLVQWHNGNHTEENAIRLDPYDNPDDHEVWPGDRVSYLPDEEILVDENGFKTVRSTTIGIVQSVNSRERIARVRWYKDVIVDLDAEKMNQYPSSAYGRISDTYSYVSLYEIAAHPGLEIVRGSLAIVMPHRPWTSPADEVTCKGSPRAVQQSFLMEWVYPPIDPGPEVPPAWRSKAERHLTLDTVMNKAAHSKQAAIPNIQYHHSATNLISPTQAQSMDCFGEVVDVCLDGDVVVRFGASPDAHEVKVPVGRIAVIDSGDPESSEGGSEWTTGDESISNSDESTTVSEENSMVSDSTEAIDIAIEYEEDQKGVDGGNADDWVTDGEEEITDPTHEQSNNFLELDRGLARREVLKGNESSELETFTFKNYPNMPASFAVLQGSSPQDHHFVQRNAPLTADLMRRISKEQRILASSLPDGVFVRSWEDRLDLLRILIIGSADTPYEYAPFIIDLHFSSSYSASPPEIYFHSWTKNAGRINPNLYEDGTICLSLLGTWHSTNKGEGWSSKTSTVLQIIVSIMGLVLVKEPYYNEAGYEILINTPDSLIPSALYSEKAFILSKGFVRTALTACPQGLQDVIQYLYLDKSGPRLLQRVVSDCQNLQKEVTEANVAHDNVMEDAGNVNEVDRQAVRKLSTGAMIMLKKNLDWLASFLYEHDTQDADSNQGLTTT